ncbi:hypothetical protein LCGC14_3125930 [marine sediment metagenome]|uniref:YopX protein domain-containing protein n=1 Tax=marine sediment metagenome TaxID=412755 RepID=A0A0F8Y8D0_9ZZZZ
MKQREHKYRAWINDEMLYDIQNSSGANSPTFGHYLEWKDCVVMQFTGLLDKSGKEIFEGDILTEKYGRMSGAIEQHTLFVKWNEYGARWQQTDDIKNTGFGTFTSLTKDGEYEIIGNIYENDNLLK